MKLREPAVDLPIAMAILSSYKDTPIAERTTFIGEIGLSGEIRPVIGIERRVIEAKKLGFKR